ncbi:MAG: FHA domain-containing protein [Chloroflexi bacterium]|nr:FHA domain-containing protein [Chloroflexota bacterium]
MHTISFGGTNAVFGSSKCADTMIEHTFVSRRHFQIRSQDGVYYICDLDSTNGTYLNGERLQPNVERRVKDGDRISLANDDVVLRFVDPIGTVKIDASTPLIGGSPDREDLVVEPASRRVRVRGRTLDPPLSRKQFDILEILYRNKGNAVSREDIAKAGWPERIDEPNAPVSNEEIDQYIFLLRKRIEIDPSSPKLILTLPRFGFQMP